MNRSRQLVVGITICLLLILATVFWRSYALATDGAARGQAAVVLTSADEVLTPLADVADAPTPSREVTGDAPQAVESEATAMPEATATSTAMPSPTPTATLETVWIDLGDEGIYPLVGQIEIPALGLEEVIVPVPWIARQIDGQLVAEWDTVRGAVGYHQTSAPIGGPGNTVLNGHTRGDGEGEFQNLGNLVAGDEILVWNAAGTLFRYLVEDVITVQEAGLSVEERQRNAEYLHPTDDTRLTLVTCWPEWSYTHRVIVVARPG